MRMNKCRCFNGYMAAQKRGLVNAIDEEKWYMSEQAGGDVGIDAAVSSFLEKHIDRFARSFRERFCREQCPDRERCDLVSRVEELPGTDTLTRRNGHLLRIQAESTK